MDFEAGYGEDDLETKRQAINALEEEDRAKLYDQKPYYFKETLKRKIDEYDNK